MSFKDKAETEALNKDALGNAWPNKQIYTFTPLSLLQVTLQHVQTMQTVLGLFTHCQLNHTYCSRHEIMPLEMTSYWDVSKGQTQSCKCPCTICTLVAYREPENLFFMAL